MSRMLFGVFWLALNLVSVLTSPSAARQLHPGELERDSIKEELHRYHSFVMDYRRGDTSVVDRVLVWDGKRIGRVLSSIESVSDENRPWGVARFKAATMMHTDAALRLLQRGELTSALVHIGAATQVLEKAGPELRPYAARWHQASARLLRDRVSPAKAEQFLESARARLPHDPILLYESGILQERLATDDVLPNIIYFPDLKPTPPNTDTSPSDSMVRLTREDVDEIKRRRVGHLNKAAAWLRESLEADPSNMLAHLHLGRVQSLRNQNDDALKLLSKSSRSDDPAVAYLALLFTGALHERQGLLETAAHDYRMVIERFPAYPAAYIALSAVLQRTGHADESRDLLRRVVDGTVPTRHEPWWLYLVEPPSDNVARLELLRQEARR